MENFKKNLKNVLIITILIKILGFLYRILAARFLKFEVLNTLNLLIPILNLALVTSSLSIPIVLTRHVSENQGNTKISNQSIISAAIKLTLLSSSLIFFVCGSLSSLIAIKVYKNTNLIIPIFLSLPLIYFSNLSSIIKSYLEANFKYTITSLSNLIESIVKILNIFIIIFLFRNKSILIISSMTGLSLLICEICSFTYLIFKVKNFTKLRIVKSKKRDYIELLKPSFYLTSFSLIITLCSFLEPIIYFSLTKHINISQSITNDLYTSLHSFVIPFIQIASFLTYIIVKIMFPKIVKENDNNKISNLLNKSIYSLLFVEFLMLNLSKNHSAILFSLLYKKTNGSTILSNIAYFNFISFFSPLLTMTLQAKKCEKKLLKSAIISSICSLISLAIFSLIYKTSKYSIIICMVINSLIYEGQNLFYCIKKGYINISLKSLTIIILNMIIDFLLAKIINMPNIFLEISIESFLISAIYYFSYKHLISKINI